MPPIRRTGQTKQKPGTSLYETPICKIIVGDDEAIFKINEGLLQPTSFFAKHGSRSQQPRQKTAEASQGRQTGTALHTDEFFISDGSECTESDKETASIDLTDDDADYVLKGEFYYTRDAFTIFVRSLNDAAPLKPTNQRDCEDLFKAYALAQHYDLELLQNQVINALQSFYADNIIPITDVIYLVERWGDTIDCFLAAYLVEQAAYEMATDWPKYRSENEEIRKLFAGSYGTIVEQLFQSSLRYTSPGKKDDPAKQKRAWRFENI